MTHPARPPDYKPATPKMIRQALATNPARRKAEQSNAGIVEIVHIPAGRDPGRNIAAPDAERRPGASVNL